MYTNECTDIHIQGAQLCLHNHANRTHMYACTHKHALLIGTRVIADPGKCCYGIEQGLVQEELILYLSMHQCLTLFYFVAGRHR